MFEGLVRQLILGYLGQYIKDIHREQLKITLWNEEVLLENVELILEAFDYLQLPFALKQGRVGRLSIKIPWKKLGRDPIIIILEDILVCASQRDDEEWSMDAVERREFAGKKAKLAAAELAKLSRCVCDNQAGKSFISHITAKILEGIQVSIRNVHVIYCDMPSDKAQTVFGLKLTSLTAMKQNLIRDSGGKVRVGQVNKLVEIQGLEIYCSTFNGVPDFLGTDNGDGSMTLASVHSDRCINLLAPVDVSVSLSVNRSGRLETDAAQYSIDVEIVGLVMCLDEDQLQQILYLYDYLCTCQLREKYGRFRPWRTPLSERVEGWQIKWWQYAQHSVLSDVRKRLRKTSWKYLGERLSRRRRYVNLYKTKLECLRKEQLLHDAIVCELDQMEKESDIDDILNYRSAAEHELQEFLVYSSSVVGVNGANTATDKSRDDDRLSSKPQGWLKWLSRGMLGAGGTEDSSQFSGVVSDEVIKDIYEATKFHPTPSPNVDAVARDELLVSSIKFSLRQISATLCNKKLDHAIAELVFEEISVECMIWEESAAVTMSVDAVEMMNPLNGQVILLVKRVISVEKPSLDIRVYIPKANSDDELTVKVVLEPLEVTCDATFLFNVMGLFGVLSSFQFQQERVLKSLNGIIDVKSRLISKAEPSLGEIPEGFGSKLGFTLDVRYILSSRNRIMWDISLIDVKIIIPWENEKSEMHKLVLGLTALSFASMRDVGCFAPDMNIPSQFMRELADPASTSELPKEIQIQHLYDYFEVKLIDFEITVCMPCYPYTASVLEKLNASFALACCIVLDESLLKALGVYVVLPTFLAHFSPSMYGSFVGLLENVSMQHRSSDLGVGKNVELNEPRETSNFGIFVIADLESANVLIDLENGLEASCTLMVSLKEVDVRFNVMKSTKNCWICTRALKITSCSWKSEDEHILCLSENTSPSHSARQHEVGVNFTEEGEQNTSANGCFRLHYEANLGRQKYDVWLSDVDLHCYPYIIGLLVGFSDKLSKYGPSHAVENQAFLGSKSNFSGSYFDFQRFGCSNISDISSFDWESIPVDHYPFVTIFNDRSLLNLESSLINVNTDWRKVLKRRESKKHSSLSPKKEFEKLDAAPESSFGTYDFLVAADPDHINLVIVDLHLGSIRLHFHDSSCIVGSIILPVAKSSIAVHEDSFDLLCSTEGLNFSSSWWPQTLQNCLWGPALPSLSPILNIRVRKGNVGNVELSFSIQHVSCILPPEYLAVLIGYFSLPGWTSYVEEQRPTDMCKGVDTGNNISFTYKFEILDSTLFAPVDSVDHQFLKLNIPQFYCTFIENSHPDIFLSTIPSECCVGVQTIADQNHCLNLFGRDLSLCHLLLKDGASDSLKLNQDVELQRINLIAPISADVWIRIPNGSELPSANSSASTCVMLRVTNCRFIAEGSNMLVAFGALQDLVDQFLSVEKLSQCFTTDVLQFLQLMKSLKENCMLPVESSSVTFTEVRCSIQSMSLELYSSGTESVGGELVAKADLKYSCSVSLRNETPVCLDISFGRLALYSLLTSVLLAECTSSTDASVLHMNLLISDLGKYHLHFSLPCVNIWLYLSDWSKIIDLFNSFSVLKPPIINEASKRSTLDPADHVDILEHSSQTVSMSKLLAAEEMTQHQRSLIVKSENIGIKLHIPVRVSEEAFTYFGATQVHELNSIYGPSDDAERYHHCFLVIYLQSKCTELNINGRTAKLKSNLGNASGTLELCQNKSVQSWPLLQLLQVDVEAEVCNDEKEHMNVKTDVGCDSFDVWLSHHIFYLWRCMLFEFPEEDGSSQFMLSGVNFRFHLKKFSLLLTDQKWSSSGPLMEILMASVLFHGYVTMNTIEGLVNGELQVNYNNIHKVLWEPFLEPWKFQLSFRREHGKSALQNSPIMNDIHLESATHLNINVTESLMEVAFRASDMIKDAWEPMGQCVLSGDSRFTGTEISENAYAGRYAPYVLENLTSLPLIFHVYQGCISADSLDVSSLEDGKYVLPGSSYPIYIDDTPVERAFRFSPSHSSDGLGDRQSAGSQHHYIIVQLEGTSTLSTPISIDLVGVSYFEVDFSNSSNNLGIDSNGDVFKAVKEFEGGKRVYTSSGYVVPVVIDVSVQRYTKLVRLYSTVILLNATSVPFEVRFDIPFGVAPKILGPVYPGQEFPLPLHLAEAGRIRWRPLGCTSLWSEAYSISSVLSNETKIGFLRSFVCYPSLPRSDPFRCCVSVHDMCLPSVGRLNKESSLYIHDAFKQSAEKRNGNMTENLDHSKKRFIHLVTLSSPLVVKNYLPVSVSLTIESYGVTRNTLLSEVETSFYHIDSSHDLALAFHVHGFRPAILKFPRAEKFGEIAKFSGTEFSLSETITLNSEISKGPLYVTMEKLMDAFSGAREICVFVPFLLCNCIGFPLIVSSSVSELGIDYCIVPSCYDLDEQDLPVGKKDGFGLLSSDEVLHDDSMRKFPKNNYVVSTRKYLDTYHGKFMKASFNVSGLSTASHGISENKYTDAERSSFNNQERLSGSGSRSNLEAIGFDELDGKKVKFCMYSPDPSISVSEITVRLSRCLSECDVESTSDYRWSSPFSLVPPTGSTTILVPKASTNAAYVISVTSSAVTGPFSGRTRIINFQPRYVISNACSKDLCYRQKGSDYIFHLKAGQHSHIQWTDTTRELLVSLRFDEPGSQWSGCFLPEHLGDTQLKMRNYVSGAVSMIRVEVQNADDAIKGEKIVGSPHGDSGTNLILLSDDDTGFMPYRIDNFSKERLRIYQQKCEAFETVIHSYTSCPYAWDEPCYPHRLTVEVPAERVLGSYTLDEAKEYKPVYLAATAEKPERRLLLSVHAEGALKVLSVVDSSYHNFDDTRGPHSPRLNEKRELEQKQESFVLYKERISIAIPVIGISLMNSYPQELLFLCARNTVIDLVQSLDQQKFSLKISSLQIDNQLHNTPYPVILSFDHDSKNILTSQIRAKDDSSKVRGECMKQVASDNSFDPVISLDAAKWRNKDIALVSFEYIGLRMADFHLELEQDVILGLFDFFKTVSSRFESQVVPHMDSVLHPLSTSFSFPKLTCKFPEAHVSEKADGDIHSISAPMFVNAGSSHWLPPIVPVGAPWQKIYLLARKQKKIYVELFELAPIKLTLSFSSSPWVLRNGILTSGEYLLHRGLMAVADVEGAQIHLGRLVISHQLASWESIREILIRHYTRQLLHEMYKVFGSAGVIGNPMGFARSVGLGIKDFLSVPARSFMQSPSGLIAGMAQGTTSLLSNTVYALSDAATQVSRAAHKGIVAFTMDDPAATEMERQQKGMSSHGKGVINELLEGLTGLLQSPIRGAEKHGLPGVLSGIALGVTGLVAKPAASILEVTEKTARSIRNRSRLYHPGSQRLRIRLPRPLSRDHPLRPYSWEEAVGVSVLADADDTLMLKDEILVLSKALKQGGRFVIITERLILIISCSSLVNLGKPEFRGVPVDPKWVIEAEIRLDSVIHIDTDEAILHIVGSNSDVLLRQNQNQSQSQNQNQQHRSVGKWTKQRWHAHVPLPLFQTNLEFLSKEEAEDVLQILLSTIQKGKERGWGCVHRLHQRNLK